MKRYCTRVDRWISAQHRLLIPYLMFVGFIELVFTLKPF